MKTDKKEALEQVIDRIDFCFYELVAACHDLEGLGCKRQEKKLDTITGSLDSIIHELCEKVRK